jgi:hypothetical protein
VGVAEGSVNVNLHQALGVTPAIKAPAAGRP